MLVPRAILLPHPGRETFFLWGPRQTGKSTLLRQTYPQAFWVDLLKAEEYRRYLQRPELLREELAALTPAPPSPCASPLVAGAFTTLALLRVGRELPAARM